MGGVEESRSSIATVLPYLVAVNIIVGLLIVYSVRAFRSGRWVEEQTHAHSDLQRQIVESQAEFRRITGEIKIALVDEHKQRREFIERINETVGALALNVARNDERLKTLEKR